MSKKKQSDNQSDKQPSKRSNEHSDTAKQAGKFIITGTCLAIFNFTLYTFLARVFFKNNDLLWINSIISYTITTIVAYFAHSRITWKCRTITRHNIIMFFVWNGITGAIITPALTWMFGFITPLYHFAHGISLFLHFPFDYEFVESTGIFCLTTGVTLILNFFFYDRIVFSKKNSTNSES